MISDVGNSYGLMVAEAVRMIEDRIFDRPKVPVPIRAIPDPALIDLALDGTKLVKGHRPRKERK